MTGPLRAPALTAMALAYGDDTHKTDCLPEQPALVHRRCIADSSLSHALVWHPRNRPRNQRRHPLYNHRNTNWSFPQNFLLSQSLAAKAEYRTPMTTKWKLQKKKIEGVGRRGGDYPSEEPSEIYWRRYTPNGKIAWAKPQLGTSDSRTPSQRNTWHFEPFRG